MFSARLVEHLKVFWHSRPAPLVKELIHSYKLASIIDFAAADGTFAVEASRKRVPYLGFCLTDTHATKLRAQLIQKIMMDMTCESDSQYNPDLASLLSQGALLAKKTKQVTHVDAQANFPSLFLDGAVEILACELSLTPWALQTLFLACVCGFCPVLLRARFASPLIFSSVSLHLFLWVVVIPDGVGAWASGVLCFAPTNVIRRSCRSPTGATTPAAIRR